MTASVAKEIDMSLVDASGHALDNLCASCRRFPQSPKLLSCLHTMCESCAEQCVRATQRVIRCPTCNDDTPLPSAGLIRALPTNALPFYQREGKLEPSSCANSDKHSVERLCEECVEDEARPAVAVCNECRLLLCALHAQGHRKSRRTAHHTLDEDIDIASVSRGQSRVHCALHPGQDPCCYCKECGKLICSSCRENGEHDHHCTVAISEVGGQERQALVEGCSTLQEGHLRSLKAAARAAGKAVDACDQRAQAASRQVEQVFNSLRKALDEEERRLVNDVDAWRRKTGTPLEKQEAYLLAESKRLESAMLFADICTKTMTDAELLEVSQTISTALKQATSNSASLSILPPSSLVVQCRGADELKATVLKGVGYISEVPVAHVIPSTSPYYHGKVVVIKVLRRAHDMEAGAYHLDDTHINVTVEEPDGCKRHLTKADVAPKSNSNEICRFSFTPTKLGMHTVLVDVCGQHAERSPLTINVAHSLLQFDAKKCDQKSVKISSDRRTATCVSSEGCRDVICGPGFTTGHHQWTVRMNDFHERAGQLTGVATLQDADSSSPHTCLRHKLGFTRWGKGSRTNVSHARSDGQLSAWEKGDLVMLELDCDRGVLMATHPNSESVARIINLPTGQTYYLLFNLYLPPTSVTLMDGSY